MRSKTPTPTKKRGRVKRARLRHGGDTGHAQVKQEVQDKQSSESSPPSRRLEGSSSPEEGQPKKVPKQNRSGHGSSASSSSSRRLEESSSLKEHPQVSELNSSEPSKSSASSSSSRRQEEFSDRRDSTQKALPNKGRAHARAYPEGASEPPSQEEGQPERSEESASSSPGKVPWELPLDQDVWGARWDDTLQKTMAPLPADKVPEFLEYIRVHKPGTNDPERPVGPSLEGAAEYSHLGYYSIDPVNYGKFMYLDKLEPRVNQEKSSNPEQKRSGGHSLFDPNPPKAIPYDRGDFPEEGKGMPKMANLKPLKRTRESDSSDDEADVEFFHKEPTKKTKASSSTGRRPEETNSRAETVRAKGVPAPRRRQGAPPTRGSKDTYRGCGSLELDKFLYNPPPPAPKALTPAEREVAKAKVRPVEEEEIPLDYGKITSEEEDNEEEETLPSVTPFRSDRRVDDISSVEEEDDYDLIFDQENYSEDEDEAEKFIRTQAEALDQEEVVRANFSDDEDPEEDINEASILYNDRKEEVYDEFKEENLENNKFICKAMRPWSALKYPEGRKGNPTAKSLWIGTRYYVNQGRSSDKEVHLRLISNAVVILKIRDTQDAIWSQMTGNRGEQHLATLLEGMGRQWSHANKVAHKAKGVLRAARAALEDVMRIIKRNSMHTQRNIFLLIRRVHNLPNAIIRYLQEQQANVETRFLPPQPDPPPGAGPAGYRLQPAPPAIPTHEAFVFEEGREDKTSAYVRACRNAEHPPRYHLFPLRLQLSISQMYRVYQPKAVLLRVDFDEQEWKNFTAEQFLKWTDSLRTIRDSKQSNVNLVARYLQTVKDNPILIKVTNLEKGEHKEFDRVTNELIHKWNQLETQAEIDRQQEKTCAQQILAHFSVKNAEKTAEATDLAKEEVRAHIGHMHWSDAYKVLPVLKAIQYVATVIQHRQKSAALFVPSSSSSHSQRSRNQDDEGPERKKQKNKKEQAKQKNTSPSGSDKPSNCKGCGYNRKKVDGKVVCPRNNMKGCRQDPRVNESDKPWDQSTAGKQWLAKGYKCLPGDESITLDNAPQRALPTGKLNICAAMEQNRESINHVLIPFYIEQAVTKRHPPGRARKVDAEAALNPPRKFGMLLDSGNIGTSVISPTFWNALQQSKIAYATRDIMFEVNSAFQSTQSEISKQQISFTIYSKSERKRSKWLRLDIKAVIVPIKVDLILDRESIKGMDLVKHYPSHFTSGKRLKLLQEGSSNSQPVPTRTTKPEEETAAEEPTAKDPPDKAEEPNQEGSTEAQSEKPIELAKAKPNLWQICLTRRSHEKRRAFINNVNRCYTSYRKLHPTKTGSEPEPVPAEAFQSYLNTLELEPARWQAKQNLAINRPYQVYLNTLQGNISHKSAYDREGGLPGIPDNKLESIPAEIIQTATNDGIGELDKIDIQGHPQLKAKLRALVEEFKPIFQSSVVKEPANIPPFVLDIDETKWKIPSNRTRGRPTDREREKELARMLKILEDNDVIEPSTDSYWSHAFLVPKPKPNTWRLVLDFKNLNKATKNHNKWPLPQIKEMLTRVGESRPNWFAVFDLTSGYYQAPIDLESRQYTTFATRHGLYRWKRLPMGLRDAGSYFQQTLVNEVLQGLIMHDGVELYLDDCMVHAQDEEEYLRRLRQVFERFQTKGITLNPEKCHLGLSTIEYVGHTINANGLHYTRSKLDSVLNFPVPTTKKNIKSFLGLINHFHTHIKNHHVLSEPLQRLVDGYDKRQARHPIKWGKAQSDSFTALLKAIDECPMLWFMDDTSPIFLETDASDYGIGAYLYQVVTAEDGTTEQRPISFISKAIPKDRSSWDIPKKEGFAIFYALQKWEYLLRDRQFTIRTDHENLTRLRQDHDSCKMVRRWFMAYQEYDILEWQHVRGDNNLVADAFSRLCADLSQTTEEERPHPAADLYTLTGALIPTEAWDKISQVHNAERGHGGQETTIKRLTNARQEWKYRAQHVREFIHHCPCCQKMDQIKPIIKSYPFTTSTYGLWDEVSVDYIENLTPDNKGNNMIIVIIDNFSRFVDLYPTDSTKAGGAAQALLNFVGKYATPRRFRTDNGTNFKSRLMAELLQRLGSDHHLTQAHSKEQNSIVERANKEVVRHLRNLIFEDRIGAKWSDYLPLVQRIMNTKVHSATGLAPAEIVFPSHGIRVDKSVLNEVGDSYITSDYIKALVEAQATVIELAQKHLRDKDEAHIKAGTPTQEQKVFEPGSYVTAEHRNDNLRRGPNSKLLPFRLGPLQVLRREKLGIYVLRDLVTLKETKFHESKLKEYLHDARNITPLAAAAADFKDEFIVEKILDMEGDPKASRKSRKFKVRWAGAGPEYDTWEPWDNVRDNVTFQDYLKSHTSKAVRSLAKRAKDDNARNRIVVPNDDT